MNHRAAAARERAALRQDSPTATDAFRSAFALLVFDEALNGSPFDRPDPVSAREDDVVRDVWARLRARWPRGR